MTSTSRLLSLRILSPMTMLWRNRLVALGLCVLGACSSGDVQSAEACGPNGACPAGYTCDPKSSVCRLVVNVEQADAPVAPDARVPAADAPPVDATGSADAAPGAPALTIDPLSQDFGPATLGTALPPKTFTVSNSGGAATAALVVAVSDLSSYGVVGGTCAAAALAPGATCSVLVQFKPSGQSGSKPATLTIGAAGVSTPAASLIGTALSAGELVIESSAIDFGDVAVGDQSDEALVVLHNSGQSRTGPVAVVLSDTHDFVVSSNPCADGLAAGASCSVGVRFTPASVGVKDGAALTASADPGGAAPTSLRGTGTVRLAVLRAGTGTGRIGSRPQGIDCGATCGADFSDATVTLEATADTLSTFTSWSGGGCTGTAPCVVTMDAPQAVTATFTLKPALVQLTPQSQDFGSVALGGTSLPITMTVTNQGGAATGAIAASVDDTADYTVTGGTCIGRSLDGGGKSCTITVVFDPTGGSGAKPATLTVSPGGSPALTASLTGTALTVAALTVVPTSMTFDPVPLGDASPEAVFTVTNGGQEPSGLLAVMLSDAASFTISSNDCTTALATNASCHVGVKLTPTSVGLKQGVSLTITGTPGGSVPVSLQGTGTASLTVINGGGGSVSSLPTGIDCGVACSASFTESPVTLTATADSLHDFTGWSDGGCSGTGTCVVTLDAASQAVTASFTAKPASLSVAPTSQSFGAVTIGAASPPVAFTVSNGGGSTSGTIAATVDDDASYTVTGGTCVGNTLAAGASCTVSVRFNPAAPAGTKPATLTVAASPGGTALASLTGTALTPAKLTIAPSSNDFGPLAIGSPSAVVPFSVKNTGQSPTGTLATSLSGSDASQFSLVTNDCPATLPPSGSCTIGVQFKPTSVGAKAASLTVAASPGDSAASTLHGTGTAFVNVTKTGGGTVTSDPTGISCGATCGASFSVTSVTLTASADPSFVFTGWSSSGCSGTGACVVTLDAANKPVTATFTATPAALSLAPTSQDFGAVAIGAASPSTSFTVSNTGGSPSGVIGASVSDTASYTVVDGTCLGATLAAGATCKVNVRFNPAAPAGAKPATLTVTASPGGSPTSSLTGTALTPAQLALSPSPTDFGSVAVGSTGTAVAFTLKNTGQTATGTLAVGLSGTGAQSFAIASNNCPATLAPGATCAIGVRFAPTSVAAKSATLTASATPGGAATATLTGTGTVRVAVAKSGSGTVTSDPTGLSCGTTCMHDFGQSSVTLTATPAPSFVFDGWSDACTGTGPCALTLSATTVNVSAKFVCPGGTSLCNGVCVDLTSDEANCGACGNQCVAQSCVASMCETTVTQVPSPTTVPVLALWGSASNNVWGVGSAPNNLPAIVHWNGTAWSSVATGLAQGCGLSSVWGTSASDVWAVSSCSGIITHFDGSAWHEVTQSATTSILNGVWASSPTDVWAVGNGGLILHNSNGTWSAIQVAGNPLLRGIWGTSSTNIWAVGQNGTILHWTGGPSWTPVPSGLPANTGDFIIAIRGFGPNDIWASGSAGTVLHWNGTSWSVVLADFQLTGAELNALGGSGDNDLFVGGFDGALFHKGTGSTFTPLPFPDPVTFGATQLVGGVWSNGPGDTWIGGFNGNGVILHSP